MAYTKRLNSVVKLMNHRQQEAARRLGACARQLEQQRQRLQELEGYKLEYMQNFQDHIRSGMSMSRMNDYHHFIAQLDQAISQQEHSVNSADKEYECCRQEWLSQRCSAKAVDKVVSRYQAEERRLEDKREQHVNDESSRCARGRDWAGNSGS